MTTDSYFIEIDQGTAPSAPERLKRFACSHRLLSSTLALAVISGITLTSCYAVKSHSASAIPRPKPPLVFKVDQERPWLNGKSPPARPLMVRNGASSIQAASFHLTFDDGPHPVHTPKILDFLKARHLHATFFVVGENAARYPALIQRIVAEGHQIGNHTWSHPALIAMSDTAVRSQLQRTHDAIFKACGKAPTAFRPPYGKLSARQRAWIEKEFHYQTVLWNIDTLDWTKTTSTAVAATIEHGLRKSGPHIILAHDIHPRILPALQSLLPKLQARGPANVKVARTRSILSPLGQQDWGRQFGHTAQLTFARESI